MRSSRLSVAGLQLSHPSLQRNDALHADAEGGVALQSASLQSKYEVFALGQCQSDHTCDLNATAATTELNTMVEEGWELSGVAYLKDGAGVGLRKRTNPHPSLAHHTCDSTADH